MAYALSYEPSIDKAWRKQAVCLIFACFRWSGNLIKSAVTDNTTGQFDYLRL